MSDLPAEEDILDLIKETNGLSNAFLTEVIFFIEILFFRRI